MGALLFGVSNTLFNVNEVSLHQQVTPDRLLGRVGTSMQCIGVGILTLGALLGCCGFFLAVLWTWFSPVRKLRQAPPMYSLFLH